MSHQTEKPPAPEHVELARETSATTDIGKAGPGALSTLARLRQGKADAAMEILQGERVEMTDEQVSSPCPLGSDAADPDLLVTLESNGLPQDRPRHPSHPCMGLLSANLGQVRCRLWRELWHEDRCGTSSFSSNDDHLPLITSSAHL
jgi:hypothetical protein